MKIFITANKNRLNYLKDESFDFIEKASNKFDEEQLVISFSGGKDSTVTADIVTKALSNPSLIHIFGNTTLEFPSTVAYAERFRENHPQSIFLFAKFGRLAPELGPKLLHEVLILDIKTNVPILSIQPFSQNGYEYAVKVRTMNVKDHDKLQRMAGYQVRKFNACRKCLKCESIERDA